MTIAIAILFALAVLQAATNLLLWFCLNCCWRGEAEVNEKYKALERRVAKLEVRDVGAELQSY